MSRWSAWLPAVVAFALAGQIAVPPPPPDSEQKPPSPPSAPPKPVLENLGKPIRVPLECGESEILELGLACSATDPCPVYLELTALEAVGLKLFVIGNLHTDRATIASVLLASSDGGKSWVEGFERIRFGSLESLRFLDFEFGWIAGQLIQNLPRDPFLLITRDGGATWRRHPVYSEGRVGSIDRMSFTSRTDGTLVVDRSQAGEENVATEVLETKNGGELWMLREVLSKRSATAPASSPADGWRLRADGPSKSYRIERRQGDRWVASSSFLVSAGECKGEESKLAEPPPEEPEVEKPKPEPVKPEAPKPPRRKPTLERKPGGAVKP